MAVLKKVVDASGLASPELEDYLSKSTSNFVVMTEFVTMEMYRGSPAVVRGSLSIVSRFLGQVILLKWNAAISKLAGRPEGLQKRLQDKKRTQAFARYCRQLFGNSTSERLVARDFAGRANVAKQWSDRMLGKTPSLRNGIENLQKTISSADLKAIRRKELASQEFTHQLEANIMGLTSLHFDEIGLNPKPTAEEALFTFPFRYAVSAYAISLWWIINGNFARATPATLRNDYIDMTYVAYGTFFDGVITRDKKLRELFTVSRWILANVFGLR